MAQGIAIQVVESLRKGIPPQRGVDVYSVGNEELMAGIKKFLLSRIGEGGIIRFINGSWGAGKTHFFRLLREVVSQNNCLVSNVELNVNDAVLNKFERIFSYIVRNISTGAYLSKNDAAAFGQVLKESLAYLSTGSRELSNEVSYEDYVKAREALILDMSIDIDFKKMIQKYWETFLPLYLYPGMDEDLTRGEILQWSMGETQKEIRGEILQWFCGEGGLARYRNRFEVNKMVNKDNAQLMLQSIAGFVRLSGYKGLVILFDEAQQAYSIMRHMRKSPLRDAHNNLLSLIDIEALKGLFIIYATTPDFFTDPKYGIVTFGALSKRVGKPEPQRQPRALDTIWNFDRVVTELSDYQTAANRILSVYATAYPEARRKLPSEIKVECFVKELYEIHPELSAVGFWRVLLTALITHFDDHIGEKIRSAETMYDDVMDRLRQESFWKLVGK